MIELLEKLLEEAKGDKATLISMKDLAVKSHQYALAAVLRDLEKELFPLTEEQKEASSKGRVISAILFMTTETRITERGSWLVYETIKKYNEKEGNFSIDDASELRVKADNLFI